jgi:large subunit ribosomal protein L6
MSRVGKKPIKIVSGVKVKIEPSALRIEGPKGKLSTPVPEGISFELKDGELVARRSDDSKQMAALHGLARSLAANAVKGVTEGFSRGLDIVGIGYKAEVKGGFLTLILGYSHPIEYPIPEGITIKFEKVAGKPLQNYVGTLTISGADRQQVGQVAANLRGLRQPDPYKGKGIRYVGEVIKLKVGKKAA